MRGETENCKDIKCARRISAGRVERGHLLEEVEHAVVYAEIFFCDFYRCGHFTAHAVHRKQEDKSQKRSAEHNHASDKPVVVVPFACCFWSFLLVCNACAEIDECVFSCIYALDKDICAAEHNRTEQSHKNDEANAVCVNTGSDGLSFLEVDDFIAFCNFFDALNGHVVKVHFALASIVLRADAEREREIIGVLRANVERAGHETVGFR